MEKSDKSKKITDFILANLSEHSSDIVALVMRKFKITRPGVHKHLTRLIEEGKIEKSGNTKNIKYTLQKYFKRSWKISTRSNLHEDEVWNQYLSDFMIKLPKNIAHICHYGFTEMFNNVIDHSGATSAKIIFALESAKVILEVHDNGIGIFNKIQQALKLEDIRESILHLSKGKLTTDAERHSGEGIFFTSRVFDQFTIRSGKLEYLSLRHENDWFLQSIDSKPIKGTFVQMQIALNSQRTLEEVFRDYTDSDFNFSKTNIFVKIAKLKGENYISRSQAKRLLLNLDKFKKIIFDFQEVPSVGQGFVDEVFRIFQNEHPHIQIEYKNANEDVEFMIKRGLPKS